jgi:hypothetical protein
MGGEGLQEQLDALARRIDLLERRIRLQRGAAAVSLMIIAAGGLAWAGGGPPGRDDAAVREVRARRIALVGAEGRTLAALEPAPAGGARLALFGAGDVPRIAIEVGGNDARVSVLGPGKAAVTLASDGIAPRLAVSDRAGNDRVWLAVRLGSPVLQFLDPRGMARAGITTFDDDTGLAVISGTDRTRPGLVLMGRDRTVVWSVP